MGGLTVEITDANWKAEVLDSSIPVLVDFWASWCPPCRALAPTIEKLAADYEGRAKIGKLDVDHNTETPSSLRIASIPTVVLFQGGCEVSRLVGLRDESAFKNALEQLGVS